MIAYIGDFSTWPDLLSASPCDRPPDTVNSRTILTLVPSGGLSGPLGSPQTFLTASGASHDDFLG